MTCGYADYEHVTVAAAQPGTCKFCKQGIVWGTTSKGKAAPADPDTHRNHWITCPGQKAAREAYPRG